MSFNLEKCKVMHLGYGNVMEKYTMLGKELATVKDEKDLGVMVSEDMKVSTQCSLAAKKGYQVLGMINRTFTSKKRRFIYSYTSR